MNDGFVDEQLPENCHQVGRDLSRTTRCKAATLVPMHDKIVFMDIVLVELGSHGRVKFSTRYSTFSIVRCIKIFLEFIEIYIYIYF